MSPRRRLVALGSSFASGPGISPMADRRAGRSARNYPHLVAERLGLELVDATVAGATTATILDVSQRAGWVRFAPQIGAVRPDTALVTVTAGGNDLGYVAGVMGAAWLHRMERSQVGRPIARRLRRRLPLDEVGEERKGAAAAGLVRIVERVRERAPGARVLLVDYLPIFPGGTSVGAAALFTAEEVAYFGRVAGALSDAFREAAERTGAELIAASEYEPNHGVGSAIPWVAGLQPLRMMGSSFHPTAAGMSAVAERVVARLG